MLKTRDCVVLDDEGRLTVKDGDRCVWVPCLAPGCSKKIEEEHGRKYRDNLCVKLIYRPQLVVCPHCGQKLKIRCYKNKTIEVTIREK